MLKWIKDSWELAHPFLLGKNKWYLCAMLALVVIFNLLIVYVTVKFNLWYNVFYNTLGRHDQHAFVAAIYKFTYLAIIYIVLQIVAFFVRKMLEIKWRKFLTGWYLNLYLESRVYYKAQFVSNGFDNPDQRIANDINDFIVTTLDLSLGLLNSVVTLVTFVVILWRISGVWQFTLFHHHMVIAGYMVWASLLYAIVGTIITFKLGRPLIKLNYQQQVYEADFRSSLIHVRNNSESVALFASENLEQTNLNQRFDKIITNFVATVFRRMKLDIFGVGYGQAAIIFPIVVASPRYFAKLMNLGGLMQIVKAFGQVQDALSYFVNSYTTLASYRAVMDRLLEFNQVNARAKALKDNSGNQVAIHEKENGSCDLVALRNVFLSKPGGHDVLINNIDLCLQSGDRLLIMGPPGSGKTTLLRAIAGIWPYVSGDILVRAHKKMMFTSQEPYLPYGNLRQILCYPQDSSLLCSDEVLAKMLKLLKIEYLSLDMEINYNTGLSLGEKQKIAFGRILLHKPDILCLDEATAALDEDTEAMLYEHITKLLPESVIISVGHRSTLKKWHTKVLVIQNEELHEVQ